MFLKALASFFKIGCIGFGGGSALIPIVEAEMVTRRKAISIEKYTEHTIVANITPGALPVKLGALIGYDISGLKGMVAGASAIALPGVAVTVLLLALLSQLASGAVHIIEMASVGIAVFIIYILLEYILKVQKNSRQIGFGPEAVVIMFAAFFLSFGREIRDFLTHLFGGGYFWSNPPILDISTIDILKLSFFIIFFTGGNIKSWRMAAALAVTAAFLLFFGKNTPYTSSTARMIVQIVMVLLSLMVFYDAKKQGSQKTKKPEIAKLLQKLGVFILFTGICCLPALIMLPQAMRFILDGALSTVTSFGGGEAYLTVASGMFVDTGMLDRSVFYSQIVPIANALPGPILVKILAGMGYMIGFEGAGMGSGFALALAGFGVAVGVTCIVCILIYTLYDSFSELTVFGTLKLWILPVICGLLLSVILSMIGESMKVAAASGMAGWIALLFMAALFAVVRVLSHRFKLNDVLLILISGGLSVFALMVFR